MSSTVTMVYSSYEQVPKCFWAGLPFYSQTTYLIVHGLRFQLGNTNFQSNSMDQHRYISIRSARLTA